MFMTWTRKKEKTINKWLKNCTAYSWLHKQSCDHYKSLFDMINIPIIITSGILVIVTGIGAQLRDFQTYLLIIACVINSGISGLSFYLSAYKPLEIASKHDIASKDYQTLVIELESLLSQEKKDRPDARIYMTNLTKRFSSLINNTPHILDRTWKHYELSVKNKTIYKETNPGSVFGGISSRNNKLMTNTLNITDTSNITDNSKISGINDNNFELVDTLNKKTIISSKKDSDRMKHLDGHNENRHNEHIVIDLNQGLSSTHNDSHSDSDSESDYDSNALFAELKGMGIDITPTNLDCSFDHKKDFELARAKSSQTPKTSQS
jgi:hypothetical protein